MKNISSNKWWSIAVMLLIIINITTLAIIWYSTKKAMAKQDPPENSGGAAAFIINELQLDSAQQQAYKVLREQHQRDVRQVREQVRDAKQAFFNLLSDTSVSDETIKTSAANASAVEQRTDIITFHHFQQVRAICNPAQKKKFDSIIKQIVTLMGEQKHKEPPSPRRNEKQGDGGESEKMPPPQDDGPPPPPQDGTPPPRP